MIYRFKKLFERQLSASGSTTDRDISSIQSTEQMREEDALYPPSGHGTIEQLRNNYPDVSDADLKIVADVLPFTMTSVDRLIALITSVEYIHSNKIPGSLAECGVWKGGSVMAMIKVLQRIGVQDRDIFLFDTFQGMSEPTEVDVSYGGETAIDFYKTSFDQETDSSSWCRATLEEVKEQIQRLGYPEEKIHYIEGKVEESIPKLAPKVIALLRLDTDWFESTAHELEHLFPRLSPRGILLIDDYGYWQGARKAVDEYFSHLSAPPLLHRIDSTGRLCIKI